MLKKTNGKLTFHVSFCHDLLHKCLLYALVSQQRHVNKLSTAWYESDEFKYDGQLNCAG